MSGRLKFRKHLASPSVRKISALYIVSAFAGCTRAPWAIQHSCAGGIELLFVVGKAKGHATHIWNSACAEPHRIRRAGICIRLSIGNCWQRCRDHDRNRDSSESHGAQFTHDVCAPILGSEWQRSQRGFVPYSLLREVDAEKRVVRNTAATRGTSYSIGALLLRSRGAPTPVPRPLSDPRGFCAVTFIKYGYRSNVTYSYCRAEKQPTRSQKNYHAHLRA